VGQDGILRAGWGCPLGPAHQAGYQPAPQAGTLRHCILRSSLNTPVQKFANVYGDGPNPSNHGKSTGRAFYGQVASTRISGTKPTSGKEGVAAQLI
jgi:hypothetical protein